MRFVFTLVTLAAFCPTSSAQKPEPKYEGKPLGYWVERLQKAENEKDRSGAEDAICAFGLDGAPAVPTLMVMLDDRSPSYQAQVVRILCAIGPGAKGALPELVKRLKEKYAEKPREGQGYNKIAEVSGLVEIIGAIGPDAKDAVPAVSLLVKDADYDGVAIKALCSIGPMAKETIPLIRRAVIDSLAPDAKGMAKSNVDVLYKLGPDIAPLLIDLLAAPDKSVRFDAFEGLNKLPPEAIQGLPRLAKWLTIGDPVTRYYAASLTWRTKKDKAAVPVLAALLNETDSLSDGTWQPSRAFLVAVKAAESLGEIGRDAKQALPALEKAAAMGFVMWYFFEAGYPQSRNTVLVPVASRYARLFEDTYIRVAVGKAATKAIRKIAQPPDEHINRTPGDTRK